MNKDKRHCKQKKIAKINALFPLSPKFSIGCVSDICIVMMEVLIFSLLIVEAYKFDILDIIEVWY